jgi:hypothetical protein
MLDTLLEMYLKHTFDIPIGLIKSDLHDLSRHLTPEELKTAVKQAYFFRTQEIDNLALRASVCVSMPDLRTVTVT